MYFKFKWCNLSGSVLRLLVNWILFANILESTFLSSLSQAHVIRSYAKLPIESLKISSQISNIYENSEIAHISFTTELRHRRDLSQNEYHIIKLHRKDANKTLEIHLVKADEITSEDFKVVIKNGDETQPEDSELTNSTRKHCVYKGVIAGEEDGKVALSACGNEPGFSGIIVTNDGNWIIEPQKDVDKDKITTTADGDEETVDNNVMAASIPHLIVKVDSNSYNAKHGSRVADELHVPRDELEKAAAQLAKAEEAKAKNELDENEDNSYDDDFDDNDNDERDASDTNPDDNTTLEEQHVLSLVPSLSAGSENKTSITSSQLASSDTTTKSKGRRSNKRASPTTKAKSKAATTATSSAESTKKIVVEIAVFADEDFYSQMKIRYPKDTTKKIKEYVLTLVQAMDILYQHDSLGTDLHFKLVHLEIQKKRPSKLSSHGGKAKSYLTSFCDYAGDLNTNNRKWDHALMLTGHDLIEEGATSTAGLAWAGTMCYQYYSCSLSEGTQLGSVFIITHEIGHSMGMEHDGMGVSADCDEEKYLMSPTTGPGKVTWSTCSGKNLKDFLKYGTSELRGGKSASKPTCMTESLRDAKSIQYSSSTLPGQKFDATKQCILSMGKKFTPVMRKDNPFNNICSMLYCGNGTHAISTHPALDGTSCSTGKECAGGQCIDKK